MNSLRAVARLASIWILLVTALGTGLARSASASTTDLVNDFSYSNSTFTTANGTLTYEVNGSAFSNSEGYSNVAGLNLPGWWTGQDVPNSIYILQNVTTSPYNIETISDPINTLWMDPESGNVSVVFTAASAGTYAINGDFLGIDTVGNSHPVEILENAATVLLNQNIVAGQDISFNESVALNSGDTIAFIVSQPGSTGCTYCYLSTGLDGTITLTPEPASMLLFGTGLLGVGFVLRKRVRV